MAKFKVIDKDKGWKKIAEEFRKASQQPFVKVGFVGSSGEAIHKNSTETVASIAAEHEYGTEKVPERSFIRGTLIKESAKVQSTIEQLLKNVLFQKIDVQGALGRLGVFAVSLIKDRIVTEHIPPPLAESTIAAKTRDGKTGEVPLVNTGQMLNSIRHEVIMDGRSE
jgi:hypothetical protein